MTLAESVQAPHPTPHGSRLLLVHQVKTGKGDEEESPSKKKGRRGSKKDNQSQNHRDKRSELAGEGRRAEGQKGRRAWEVCVLGEGLVHQALSRN